MKDSLIIKLLYNTILGRLLLKVLVHPIISRASAIMLSISLSRWLVPVFVKINNIDMKYYEIPKGGYKSFNDFFTRKKEEKYIRYQRGELISPCDGLLTVSKINENIVFNIKHTEYSLDELLGSKELAKDYKGGMAFIFRLTPAHYHRYIWASTGYLYDRKYIGGVLHSVQPICHEKVKVFIQNTREYAVVDTPMAGKMVQMEIGALLVGRISNHNYEKNVMVCAGQEKGFFEYGGSSIVILVNREVRLSDELNERKKIGDEIPVEIGERLISRGSVIHQKQQYVQN